MMKKTVAFLSVFVLLCGLMIPTGSLAVSNSNIKKMPYSAVAVIRSEFRCGCERWSSGFMVASNALVASGVTFLCPTHNKKATAFEFWFGYISRSNCKYHYNGSTTYRYYCDFSDGFDDTNCIGYVVFPSDIGKSTGWFASRFSDATTLEDSDIIGSSKPTYFDRYGYENYYADQDTVFVTDQTAKKIGFTRRGTLDMMVGTPLCRDIYGDDQPRAYAVYVSQNDTTRYARKLTHNIYDDMKRDGVHFN